MKYDSVCTPDVQHDEANMLVEFIWLNKDLALPAFPWKGKNGRAWGKMVAAIKKLMREPYGLDPNQLAFYIHRCNTNKLESQDFAKAAVVAKKLLQKQDLKTLSVLYAQRRKNVLMSGIETVKSKRGTKTLLQLLEELENG
jgi:hypothetical protein